MDSDLRRIRLTAGLSQQELADRAGVTRQMIGTIESGRHTPGVDAAVAIARALDTTVETLFTVPATARPILGSAPLDGVRVRACRVGDVIAYAPLTGREGGEALHPADGILQRGTVLPLPGASLDGTVIVGCDPAIGLAASLLEPETRVMAVSASSRAAIDAVVSGTAHAAVVHGPTGFFPEVPDIPVHRYHLARWLVGLASVPEEGAVWQQALAGRRSVIQREAGAGVQAALERAAREVGGRVPPGPTATGHLDAARQAADSAAIALTIEPAALVTGLAFRAIEEHRAELWVADEWSATAGINRFLDMFSGRGFRERLDAIGGYDLSGSGRRIA